MEEVIPYETRLGQNPRWALMEGSMHFEKESADVQEVIRVFALPVEFADQLDPSVRESFRTLWQHVQSAPPEPG